MYINQQYWQTALAGRYPFLNRVKWKACIGLMGTFTSLRQELFRPRETELRQAGYAAMPVTRGHVYGLFAPVGGQAALPLIAA
ncbi:MAG: hypothetical protein A2487_00005 [Candidatus Raymondbacteria bacterium RifOxyC12_full_50_8]|uniref:Uncharacterized protein n=1 Tax=Candidatus Raymondbacteria bacterium RIFOXYD12_FULL_49_13 TaxID=1817890 RepID=A0A1F7F7K6_UNCRA|nr:MAG: hypothetical protein A2248_22000 [Candidatus Raymondbacteria bacterium RIFOXYA2_FULL_49_16]OGJ88421.1 MAG: hypothetical protein A2350_11280 [Candidatus Raymondbacteria bacterium RifOxyB12_full_50_8]OGJ96290.1 MAG: hypothetical protein A2453_08870 [Candidatus Raymondbacteria bacterium RIFOXYC2_FULL_50_21]OGK02497.1 MAG: hypothetical protein A2519_12215 [Candidatus Raymondbacteria bacterium RIFOXYD12_FULL_49_13]OGK03131.1 MAG: hypothetical protein A2487_00005 [Candidatus Raymondbacteria b